DKNEPVIGLTLRFSNIDSFWFTLMHELSHVKLHLSQDNFFLENIEKLHANKIEDEANELASKALIDISDDHLINIYDAKQVKRIADDLDIHPDIIAGRIRY
ncbi:MAG: ImmA/IrrE family metallo-endopeptidase, partial [Acinetobacter sp.]